MGGFLADRLQSRQTDFMHIFNFFQTFFSSIHFEKLELYNQSIKQRQHRTKLYTAFSKGMHGVGKFRKACWILSNVRNLNVDKSNEMLYNKEQQ